MATCNTMEQCSAKHIYSIKYNHMHLQEVNKRNNASFRILRRKGTQKNKVLAAESASVNKGNFLIKKNTILD